MNERLAAALRKVAEGLYEAADALFEGSDAPGAVLTRPSAVPDAAGVPEFPPFAPEEPVYEAIPLPADSPGLGRCPNHNLPWTVKAAGVSKAGKSYTAFFRCDGKDQDGTFCQKRPAKAWADAHPLV